MISLEIDGKEVSVPQGTALIQACEIAGATIPRFWWVPLCAHPDKRRES